MRKSLGSTKPKGEMKVKANSVSLGVILAIGATPSGPIVFDIGLRKSVHVVTRKMVNYA